MECDYSFSSHPSSACLLMYIYKYVTLCHTDGFNYIYYTKMTFQLVPIGCYEFHYSDMIIVLVNTKVSLFYTCSCEYMYNVILKRSIEDE